MIRRRKSTEKHRLLLLVTAVVVVEVEVEQYKRIRSGRMRVWVYHTADGRVLGRGAAFVIMKVDVQMLLLVSH